MAFDLDGTLLFDRTIDPANVQAIHRWQQAGNLAVCATGKSIFATKLALDKTGVTFDYNVLYTGAVVTDAEYNILHAQTLPVSVVRACYERFKEEPGVAIFATTLTHDYRLADNVGLRLIFCPSSCRWQSPRLIPKIMWVCPYGFLKTMLASAPTAGFLRNSAIRWTATRIRIFWILCPRGARRRPGWHGLWSI